MPFPKRLVFLFSLITLIMLVSSSFASDETLSPLREELLSYFPIISGSIKSIEKTNTLILDKGKKDGLKKGQRIILYEETVPLIHPVTKQTIGKSEKIIGSAEIVSTESDSARAIVLEGELKAKDQKILFKIPKSKIKLVYAQTNTEWAVGEAYYRELKETKRFELLDAPVNVSDKERLFNINKSAEILLLLKPEKLNGNLRLEQEIYWIRDKKLLSKSQIEISPTALTEFRKKFASLIVPEGHTLLSFRLSRSINRVATGNFADTKEQQVLIASDNEISLYVIDVDLKLKSNFTIPIGGDILWFDTGDIDRDGKDEIVITIKSKNQIISSIIKWKDGEFLEISRLEGIFLRVYEGKLLAQKFSPSVGFEGNIFYLKNFSSSYEKSEELKLPLKTNIYDFYVIGNNVFKWEDNGSLSIYDEKGIVLWTSPEPISYGVQYEKQTGIEMLSLGKWQIQSRIKPLGNGIIVVEKKPLLGFVNISTFGYKSSKLKLLQWTGFGVEQTDITEEMSGEILDYSVYSDRLFVLVKPPFGMNPKRILQGESPFETILHVLSIKY